MPNAVGPEIIHEVDGQGITENARGLMQILPSTAKGECHIDSKADDCEQQTGLCDPKTNIECGTGYFMKLLDISFLNQEKNERIKFALAAYNYGIGNVNNLIAKYGNSWEKVRDYLPQETQNYVSAVLSCNTFYSAPEEITAEYGWPTENRRLTGCFGEDRGDHPHGGIDIGYEKDKALSKDIISVSAGTVTGIENTCKEGKEKSDMDCGGRYGNFVRILGYDGNSYLYAHMESVAVSVNSPIEKGQPIGIMGNTGFSSATHLHFEIERGGVKKDPCSFIDCSLSNNIYCAVGKIDFSDFKGLYYYYDENEINFRPRPITLHMKAEDYLPALNCMDSPHDDKSVDAAIRFLSWEKQGDMACCGGRLWSCGADIPGLSDPHKLNAGSLLNNVNIKDAEACKRALGNDNLPPRFPGAVIKVKCTNDGFSIEP